MTMTTKTKKALATVRRELGFSQANMKNMLGDSVTLNMIKNFENGIGFENDFLAIYYLDIFHFITSERSKLEEHIHEETEALEPVTLINPFEKNPFKRPKNN